MTTCFQLPPENELRVEVRCDIDLQLRLLSGSAEIFGCELPPSYWIKFPPGRAFAVFSWTGATIEIIGATVVAYVTSEGPRVLIVGPSDSGKSTLANIFLGWATKQSWQTLFVDLDVGQGSLTIPGAIAAIPVKEPVDPISSIPLTAPFVYFYGHTSPSNDPGLYRSLVESLATNVVRSTKLQASGMVINTMGWVEDLGYQLMDEKKLHERLCVDLEPKSDINVLYLERLTGVLKRSPKFRRLGRNMKIQEYFYVPFSELPPHSDSVSFGEVYVYKVGCSNNQPHVHLVDICQDLVHFVLGVSRAKQSDQLLCSTVAGFIYVTDVDIASKRFSYVAPCPGPLPDAFLLIGSLLWKT